MLQNVLPCTPDKGLYERQVGKKFFPLTKGEKNDNFNDHENPQKSENPPLAMIAKITIFSPYVRGKNFFPHFKFIKAFIYGPRIYVSQLKEIFQNLRVWGAKNL